MANILAIDDEPDILNMIWKILCKDGHIVEMMSEPSTIEKWGKGMDTGIKPEHFDLILLDVMMPRTDGFELCRKIRSRVDCPIVFLTAKTDESSLVYGLGVGADDYICKPFFERGSMHIYGGKAESILCAFLFRKRNFISRQNNCWSGSRAFR